jgi:TRAP-type C4-dicarboxylate transport system substrate-binding protein
MGRMRATGAALLAGALVLTACSADTVGGTAAGDKAGGAAAPVTLRVGTDDRPERRSVEQLREFARQVEERADGSLRVEVVPQAGDDADDADGEYPGWDQVVARMVVDGELEMGMIPARTWDTEGVDSLRALHAPFLVTSEELVAAIVTSDLADELLAGLEPIGVTGLALVPESLRRLLFFGEPPATPFDLGGKQVRAPRSATTFAVLEALGAVPDDFTGGPGDPELDALRAGDLVAAESALWLAPALDGMPAKTVHGDVALFPKVNSLVINTAVLDDLTADQQAVLRDAARATVAWAVDAMPSDLDDAEAFCATGGRIVTSGVVERFHDATRSVTDDLERDPATRSLIERIRGLAADVGAAATEVPPCEPPDSVGIDRSETSHEGFPEGVYRKEITEDAMVADGLDRMSARNHAGRWTLRFADGTVVIEDVNDNSGERIVEEAVYCVADGRLLLGVPGLPSSACSDFWSARWELDGDQLRFLDVTTTDPQDDVLARVLLGGDPWTNIG